MFFTLLKARLSFTAMFPGSSSQRKKKAAGAGMIAAFAIMFLFLAVMIAALSAIISFVLCVPLCEGGYTDVYFALAAFMSFLLGGCTSITAARTQVFESGDNNLLLSMPVRHMTIILSRLASLLVIEYVTEFLIAVPCGAVYLLFFGFEPAGVVLFVLGFLLLPLLTLTVTCFVGWLVSLITSRLGRARNIFSILLYIAFFAAYFYAYTNFLTGDTDEVMNSLAANAAALAEGVRSFAVPMVWMGRGIEGSIPHFLLYAAVCIIPAAILLWIMSRTFVAMASSGKRAEKGKYTASDTKYSTIGKTLLARELSRLFSSAGYLMNSTAGILMTVVIAFLAFVKADTLEDFVLIDPIISRFVPAAIASVAVILLSMNTMSSTSISIEGKTFWVIKSLPVSAAAVLRAKLIAHVTVCLPLTLIAALALSVLLGCSPVDTVMILLFTTASGIMFAAFGLLINLLMPRFNWVNETAAAKQSGSVVVTMFAGMFMAFILGGFLFVGTFFGSFAISAVAGTAVAAGAAALMCLYIFRRGARRFERMPA